MKPKQLFFIIGLCLLFSAETTKANTAITLFSNIARSEEPIVPDRGHRSMTTIPVSAFFSDNCLELNFSQPIGEVEILISQDGETIYSSSEDIVSPISKDILLPQELSGRFLLEIKGENGTYIYGWITVD